MPNIIKPSNDNYIDSTGIVHNKQLLSNVLEKNIIQHDLLANLDFQNSNWTTFSAMSETVKIGNFLETIRGGDIKVKKDCIVRVTSVVSFRKSGSTSTAMALKITLNNTEKFGVWNTMDGSETQHPIPLQTIFQVNKNDVISLQVWVNNIRTIFYAGRCNFIVEIIK